jgi:hypothetical protein
MRFATPRDLVAAQRERSPFAWAELEGLYRDPVQDLVKPVDSPGTLHQFALRLLQEACQDYSQHDDVTVLRVWLR